MEYYIDLDSGGFTMDEFQEVKLCLETLLSIISGTQALNRDIGIDIEKIVGYPCEIAKNMLSLERLLIPTIHFRKSEEQGWV